MDDLTSLLDRALDLYLKGQADRALEVGARILGPARGTPHAAAVHRHQAEFLLASGRIGAARTMAEEAARLARATRHPGEILAATLTVLACDLHDGHVAAVHQQMSELLELTPRQAWPQAFMGDLLHLVGEFQKSIELCEKARGLLAEQPLALIDPLAHLLTASLLFLEALGCLRLGESVEARGRLRRLLALDPCPPLVCARAQALDGLLRAAQGDEVAGLAALDAAVAAGRAVAPQVHGQCLLLRGRAKMTLDQATAAADDLRAAIGLLVLPLTRQEAHLLLGRLARDAGEADEAKRAFRRAAEPSTDTHFGRRAVQALHGMVGLQAV